MLKILGKSTSINVRKVLWTCAEIGLPFEQEEWGSGVRSTDVDEFRALNPNAMVPVILDGPVVLWESNTICRYLATLHGRTDLLPSDALGRARVEQWMDWQIAELNPAWSYAFMALVRRSPEHTDPVAIAAGVQRWNRHLRLLDEHLAKAGGHAAGPHFTLADIVLSLSVNRWLLTPMERPSLPTIAAYAERLRERPGYLRYAGNGVP